MEKKDHLKKLAEEGSKPGSEKRVRKGFLSYFRRNKSKLGFGEKIETLYQWLADGKLSTRDKAVVVGVLLYFINPIDMIPDLTPFLGFSDDLGLAYFVFNYLQNRSLEDKE